MTNIDVLIGARIKGRRIALKISQTTLAESVGVRFQQVQKYESGANRVSASRLLMIAETLGVPISYFFQGLDTAVDGDETDVVSRRANAPINALTDARVGEILALVETLPKEQQMAVLAFLRTLSKTTEQEHA
ncbi:MAG: helix-turn-helix domain-containing protein [Planktotalea sp.]|uniref:helix-turn-helix domain-containing protein n=1 Tax=Planktotalea sp. TaxID=2029877 RepID=UPI003C77D1AD